jgi:hypothetical protein
MSSVKNILTVIVREAMLLLLALAMTYIASMYLTPWSVGSALPSGVSKTGWPIAYEMSKWVDYTNNKSTLESSFKFNAALVDVSFFYLLINCLELLVGYVSRYSRRENNPLRLNEWARRTVKRMIVMVVLVLIIYGALVALFAILFGSVPAQAVIPK